MITRIFNTEIEYEIDFENKIIHVLDLDYRNCKTITNAINRDWQKELIKKENLESEVLFYRWLLYPSDGIISEYFYDKSKEFIFINNRDRIINNNFKEIMEVRVSREF